MPLEGVPAERPARVLLEDERPARSGRTPTRWGDEPPRASRIMTEAIDTE